MYWHNWGKKTEGAVGSTLALYNFIKEQKTETAAWIYTNNDKSATLEI